MLLLFPICENQRDFHIKFTIQLIQVFRLNGEIFSSYFDLVGKTSFGKYLVHYLTYTQ